MRHGLKALSDNGDTASRRHAQSRPLQALRTGALAGPARRRRKVVAFVRYLET
jgi:hypothetical protein